MSGGYPQPGDTLWLEYPDPEKHRIGDRFEPWRHPNDARAWIRGQADAQPVEISGQVERWQVTPQEVTVTAPNWEAVAENTSEGNGGAAGLVTGRIHRVASVPS